MKSIMETAESMNEEIVQGVGMESTKLKRGFKISKPNQKAATW